MKELTPDHPVFEEKASDEDTVGEIIYDVRGRDAGPTIDRDGREYEYVNRFLENDDFYQGLNMIAVIRRKSDGRLFGYSYWDGQGHYDDSCDANGDEFGLECDTDVEGFDWDTDYVSYYVWEPVEEYPIKAYRKS